MNIGIFLKHSIDGFSADDAFIAELQRHFSHYAFTTFSTVEDLELSVSGFDLLITWVFKRSWYQNTPRLRAIFTPAAGADWVEHDLDGKVPVFHGAFHGPLMAETLCAMMIYFNRRFERLLKNQREHIWDRNFMSYSRQLSGQNVVIFGYGTIGRECARVLKTFGCTIWGVRHSPKVPFIDRDADIIVRPDNCTDLLSKADHIVSILPGTKANDHFFGKEFWKSVNPACYFYNLGRGNCCAEEDLIWALDNNKIAGVALDVFEQEPLPAESLLWDHPGVFVMPHASPLCTNYMPLYLNEITRQLKPFLR